MGVVTISSANVLGFPKQSLCADNFVHVGFCPLMIFYLCLDIFKKKHPERRLFSLNISYEYEHSEHTVAQLLRTLS